MADASPDDLAATVRHTLHRAIPEHLRVVSVSLAALDDLVARCKELERQMGELDAAFVAWRSNHRAELEAAEAEVARLTAEVQRIVDYRLDETLDTDASIGKARYEMREIARAALAASGGPQEMVG